MAEKFILSRFNEIKSLGWIINPYNGTNGAGLIFEDLLNISRNNFPIPDFNGIEIKTHNNMSTSLISLFSSTPYGPEIFEIKRLVSNYGYPDAFLKSFNVLNITLNALYKTKIGIRYYGKLIVSREQQKIYFYIYNKSGENIDNGTYWDFKDLKEILYRKLRKLAYVVFDAKNTHNKKYVYFNKIRFYNLKDFEYFILLIEKGIIKVSFSVGVFRFGKRLGQIHDHGTTFKIGEQHINLLFDEIRLDGFGGQEIYK